MPGPHIQYRPDEPLAGGGYVIGAGRAYALLLVAAAVLAVLHAQALTSWAETLPVSPLSDRLVQIVGSWSDGLAEIGLERPALWLKDRFEDLKSYR